MDRALARGTRAKVSSLANRRTEPRFPLLSALLRSARLSLRKLIFFFLRYDDVDRTQMTIWGQEISICCRGEGGVTHSDIFRQNSTRKCVVFEPSLSLPRTYLAKFVASEETQKTGRAQRKGWRESDYLLFVGCRGCELGGGICAIVS